MQAILERNAAEAHAKQRDMERYRYKKKVQTESKNSVPSGPIVILRNKQSSREASCDVVNNKKPRQELKSTSQDKTDKNAVEKDDSNNEACWKVDQPASLNEKTSQNNEIQQETSKVPNEEISEQNATDKDISEEKLLSNVIENSCKEANNVVDRECVEEVSEKPHMN